MLQILLHSSKTMRTPSSEPAYSQEPLLLEQAQELMSYLKTLDVDATSRIMKISAKKATETVAMTRQWLQDSPSAYPALDAFIGDIYSGLQAQSFSRADRLYANEHLLILSGLYGGLRALDCVMPYRLEMGYKLEDERYKNLYKFWGDSIAQLISPDVSEIVNLSAVEYANVITPYVSMPIITPRFLTINIKTGEPVFVVVHAKIARGAFAHWMIKNRVDTSVHLRKFAELGYSYSEELSSEKEPVFVCQEFGGLGMSIRLS